MADEEEPPVDEEFQYDTVNMTQEEYDRIKVTPASVPVTPNLNINRLMDSLTGTKQERINQLREIVKDIDPTMFAALRWKWSFWARDNQMAPPGFWTYWLLLAGRGFGKTRTGAEWVNERVQRGLSKRIALVAPTAADVRKVMVEGESGLLAISPPWNRPHFEPSKLQLVWPNGAIAQMFSAEEPERLRGPQCDTFWADELCAWQKMQETWDMLMFGFRLGKNPQGCITTTPKPVPLIKEILADEVSNKNPEGTTVVTRGSTYDNKGNLAAPFFKKVVTKYEGTRLGRQELEAAILDDMPGALWVRADIDRVRVRHNAPPIGKFIMTNPDTGKLVFTDGPEPRTTEEWEALEARSDEIWEELVRRADAIRAVIGEDLTRIAVGVDPNVSNDPNSDEIGIVVVGKGLKTRRGYVLADLSMKGSPNEWAATAILGYDMFMGDRVIYEANQGGNMVEWTIQSTAKFLKQQGLRKSDHVSMTGVHASKGKVTRAEPVSSMYEQGRISHVGTHRILEDQMCLFTSDFDRKAMGFSPDRVDSLVWGFTQLFLEGSDTGILEHYQNMVNSREEEKAKKADPSGFIKLKAPEGVSQAYGQSGTRYNVEEGFILVPKEEVKGLRAGGFVEVQ